MFPLRSSSFRFPLTWRTEKRTRQQASVAGTQLNLWRERGVGGPRSVGAGWEVPAQGCGPLTAPEHRR